MSELRKDPIVDRWVILSDAAVRTPTIPKEGVFPTLGPLCPFCPGNEHLCPPEILGNRPESSQPNDANWRLRVVPNRSPICTSRYPAALTVQHRKTCVVTTSS